METRERRTTTLSGWLALIILLGGGIGLGFMWHLTLGDAIRGIVPRPNLWAVILWALVTPVWFVCLSGFSLNQIGVEARKYSGDTHGAA